MRDRAHVGLIGPAHVRIVHLEMALVDRQVDGLAHRSARMMHVGAGIGQLHEVAEILDRAVAAALVEVVHEGRAVDRSEHEVGAPDMDRAFRVSGMLGEVARCGRNQLAGEAARKMHALALDVAAGALEQIERALVAAELDADLLEQRFRIVLDDLEAFGAEHFRDRNAAPDVGHRHRRPLQAGRTTGFASAPAFGHNCRVAHGVLRCAQPGAPRRKPRLPLPPTLGERARDGTPRPAGFCRLATGLVRKRRNVC